MRIVIDLQGAQCGSRHRGIGRYTLSLAEAMLRAGTEHEFVIALNGMFPETIEPLRARFDRLLPQSNIRVWAGVEPVNAMKPENRWRRHASEWLREAFLAGLGADVVHVTSMIEGFDDNATHSVGRLPAPHATAVTFYDVIPLIQSDVYLDPNKGFEALYREKIDHLRRADIFLAISESSRQEAIRYLGVRPDSIVDIAAAADEIFAPVDVAPAAEAQLRHRLGIPKPFLMYSGATDERKNHLRLIEAYSLLPRALRETFQLALVGRLPGHHHEQFNRQIEACGLTTRDVVITGGVSDLEMLQLYNLCHLFVFPSWHEGFGLPALEAMACGAAVIGSNTTSIPEVLGRADVLFDPFDSASIAAKTAEVLTDDALRLQLKAHATVQAAKFSWDRSARIGLAQFERLAGGRRRPPSRRASDACAPVPAVLIDGVAGLRDAASDEDWMRAAQAMARNHPSRPRRQWLVDVSELVLRDSRSGIQRVVRSVLAELCQSPPEGFVVEPVYSDPHAVGYRYARQFFRRFQGLSEGGAADEVIEFSDGDVFLGLDLEQRVVSSHAEYLATLRSAGVRVFFVVYDLIPITLPWAYPEAWDLARQHTRWLDTLQRFDGAVCISRAVADELVRWLDAFGAPRGRPFSVGWFHLGADLDRSLPTRGLPADVASVEATLAGRPTFVCVGTLEPRKVQGMVLEAFEALWSRGVDVNLVFIGKQGWEVDALVASLRGHAERGRRLLWLDGISDEYLERVYAQADCLIAPSLAEGFGLPVVEAAAHGLPIIARDIPVFREVAGVNAHYFQGQQAADLARTIETWLALKAAGQVPASTGIVLSTWKASTARLVAEVLSAEPYRRWHSTEVRRYWAGGESFGTQAGERRDREIASVGRSGCLLHGPYLSLEAGRFRAVVRGRLAAGQAGRARADVVMKAGDIVLAEVELAPPRDLLSAELACMEVDIPDKCSDLEVRVWVDDRVRVVISVVDILQLASHDEAVRAAVDELPAARALAARGAKAHDVARA